MSSVVVDSGATVFEGVGVPVMARVRLTTGLYITVATTTSIIRRIFHEGTQVGADATLVKADTIFDTLQTESDNPLWTKDETGFNVYDVIPDTALSDGDKVYVAWYYIQPTASGPMVKFSKRLHTIDDPND